MKNLIRVIKDNMKKNIMIKALLILVILILLSIVSGIFI